MARPLHSSQSCVAAVGPKPALRGPRRSPVLCRDRECLQHISPSTTLASQAASLAAGAVCTLALLLQPAPALAAEQPQQLAGELERPAASATAAAVTPVYFGSGCFWGRQYDFASVEQQALRRPAGTVSAVAGYAGGRGGAAPGGRVCYYSGPEDSVYERLGHAEVVQVELTGEAAEEQYRQFARTYFEKQFRVTPFGMMRLDPQDAGPGYRNVIGLPGGVDSPLFKILQVTISTFTSVYYYCRVAWPGIVGSPLFKEANVHGMKLVAGQGNALTASGAPTEDDAFNTVYVLDSEKLPFYRAENYHQFHNGLGKAFPKSYTQGLKQAAASAGRIGETGCPEYFFS